jgi:hypothetical protein
MVKNELTFKEIVRIAVNQRKIATNADKDAIAIAVEEAIKQEKEKIITIPMSYYKDLKYDVDIDITGESVDTRVRSATLFSILQAMTADPTMTTDPVKRKFLYTMGQDGGINMNDYLDVATKTPADMVPPEQQGRAGGGVSAPAVGQAIPGQQVQTV